jgi:hypothetical protein
MNLKEQPKKPNRKDYRDTTKVIAKLSSYEMDGTALNLIRLLQDLESKYPGCTIMTENNYDSCYYESDRPDPQIVISANISAEDQFQDAMANYNKKIIEYEAWYSANHTAIEAELAKRAAKQLKEKEKQMARLQKELDKLKK